MQRGEVNLGQGLHHAILPADDLQYPLRRHRRRTRTDDPGLNACAENFVDGRLVEFDRPLTLFATMLAQHFSHEEKAMRAVEYADLDDHLRHHQTCLDRIDRLIGVCRDQGFLTKPELASCFDMVIADISRADLKFGEFLDARGLRPDHDRWD